MHLAKRSLYLDCDKGRFAGEGEKKKRGVAGWPRLYSMGNGRTSAGLGEIRLLGEGLLRFLGRYAVGFSQPATQVNRLAALRAERKVRPFRQALRFHPPTTDRAGHL